MEKIIRTTLHAGLQKPVKLLQITDIHLVEYSDRDPQAQVDHMIRRKEVFRKEADFPPFTQNDYFAEAFDLAKEEDATLIVTGDVIDVCTYGNLAEFHRIADGKDFMYTPGSHEFASFCRSAGPDWRETYNRNRKTVTESFPNLNYTFESRVVGGINVITCDNHMDFFACDVLEKLKTEAEKGLPMVLFMHEPLTDHGLLRIREPNPYSAGTEEDYRISDEVLKFIDSCPLILATFGGHWHGEGEYTNAAGTKIFVTPGLFKGICRMIEID